MKLRLIRSDVQIADARKLTFSVNVKPDESHPWSTLHNNLSLKEAFVTLTKLQKSYSQRGVFLETKHGSLKYWSTCSSDLFNSMVLLV